MTDKARAVYSCICASVLLSYIMRETNRKKHLPGLKENSQSGAAWRGRREKGWKRYTFLTSSICSAVTGGGGKLF